MTLLPLALLTAAIGRAASPDPSALASLKTLVQTEVGVPQLSIQLPDERYQCFRMKLVSARGQAARLALDDLKSMLDRLRDLLHEVDAGRAKADEAFEVADAFEKKAAEAVLQRLVIDEPPQQLFGALVAPRRFKASLVDGDYQLERDPALPGCAPASPAQ